MQLKSVIQGLKVERAEGPLEREVTGIAYNSRFVTPGMIFVAIPGQNTDGHDHIPSAIDRGAAAVICERNGFSSQRITKIKVPDTREALARVAAEFHGHPARKLQMIAVTGTKGKTTVSFMVRHLLEAAGVKTGLIGTVRYEIGDRVIPAHRTTPEALEVHQLLGQMVRAGCKACVMEVSSHALDQKRVFGIEYDAAVFTNLGRDHLDFHGDMESYFQAKRRLFTSQHLDPRRGTAVINFDDSYGARLADDEAVHPKLTYGLQPAAQLRASQIRRSRVETCFHVEGDGLRFDCRLPLIGLHNVYNALAAIGAAHALKLDTGAIRAGLASFPNVPGRMEPVGDGRAFSVFVDYAHTADSLRHALDTVREVATGRVLLVFGCGGSRDTGKRAQMGAVAARGADLVWITNDNPRKERPEAIAQQIEEGYRGVRPDAGDELVVELDRRRAIEDAIRAASEGDVVLIAGKGHETYQEFEDTVVPFDDRVHAIEALEAIEGTVHATTKLTGR
jgi:UDP-N-acetylmuramoyl-L-alanyl-D-glutamate--2,6-diaminopimelate ligase